MRLATADRGDDGQPFPALVVEGGLVDLSAHGYATTLEAIADGAAALRGIASAPQLVERDARLRSPLIPRSVIVTGTNYRSHNTEMGVVGPPRPTANLIKFPASLAGPDDAIAIPAGALLDYEAEVAVVIGDLVVDADPAEARSAIFGLCLANDLSARDAPTTHLALAKSGDGFCPLGPWITSIEDVDPTAVAFDLAVNGEVRQRGSTSDMIHSISEIVSSFSRSLPLHPGDVVLTGSPSGVGVSSDPPRFLRPGDVVSISSPELGILTNTIVAPGTVGVARAQPTEI